MVQCCKCNRTGQCRGCACVKAGRFCSNCLPSRLGRCSNVSYATDSVATTQHPCVPPVIPPITTVTPNPIATTSSNPRAQASIHVAGGSNEVSVSVTPTQELLQVQNEIPSVPSNNRSLDPSPNLPPFRPMADPLFAWGESDSTTLCKSLRETYNEVIYWRRNCF